MPRRPYLKDFAIFFGWLIGITLILTVIASLAATAADARTLRYHFHHHHARSHHHHHASRYHRVRHVRHASHHRHHRIRHVSVAQPSSGWGFGGFGNSVVAEARSQIGQGAVYGRSRLWCARFMNWVLARTGHRGTGSDLAFSFAHYGHRIAGPQVGAIAVMPRRGGGHVGVVSGVDQRGNPVIISGNHGGRVSENVYPARRIRAYVVPN